MRSVRICLLGFVAAVFVLGETIAPVYGEDLVARACSPEGPKLSEVDGCTCCCSRFPRAVCCDQSVLEVQADVLFLDRETRGIGFPVVLDTAGNTLLTSGDVDPPGSTGMRLTLNYRSNCERSWQAVYFGTHHWHGTANVEQANDLRIPGDLALATLDFLFADQMRVDYSSRIHNVEINRWWHRYNFSLLAGFRHINLNETFNIHGRDFSTSGSDYRVDSYNNLIGGQIGAQLDRCHGRLSWDVTGKAGVFGNAAGQSTLLGDFDNTFVLRDLTNHEGNVAFVGDISLSAAWRINGFLSMRGGYNVMWLEGLALAPDQLDFTSTPTAGSAVRTGGGVLLHGAHVGIYGQW
jgi:hypothetical protein